MTSSLCRPCSLKAVIIIVLVIISQPLLDLLNLAGVESLAPLAHGGLVPDVLSLSRVGHRHVAAIFSLLDDAVIEHGLNMLSLGDETQAPMTVSARRLSMRGLTEVGTAAITRASLCAARDCGPQQCSLELMSSKGRVGSISLLYAYVDPMEEARLLRERQAAQERAEQERAAQERAATEAAEAAVREVRAAARRLEANASAEAAAAAARTEREMQEEEAVIAAQLDAERLRLCREDELHSRHTEKSQKEEPMAKPKDYMRLFLAMLAFSAIESSNQTL